MRRCAVVLIGILLIFLVLGITSCGKGSSQLGSPKTINITPSSGSIALGSTLQLSVSVLDTGGVQIFPTVTFKSSNTAIADVSTNGVVCGGKWDANFIVCTPGSTGPATITVTAGGVSNTVVISVHKAIDQIVVTPSVVDCQSQAGTTQFQAKAYNNGVDITSTVGTFTWSTAASTVATVDANGLVTAVNPGRTNVIASTDGTTSLPASYTTCPVNSIKVHLPSVTDTAFSFAPGGTQQLTADVLDTKGATLTGVPLQWNSSNLVVATASTTGLVSAVAPGTTTITASCTPPACNTNLPPQYGNAVVATVTGTSAATTVYVASTTGTSMIPIDTSTNTAGTAITLPNTPNSAIFNPQGTKLYLGSSAGLMLFDPSTNSVVSAPGVIGKILATSPDGNKTIVSDTSTNKVFYVDESGTGSVKTLTIPGAVAAEFTQDGLKAFIVGNNTLWVFSPIAALQPVPLDGPASDVAFLSTGAFGYVAGGGASSVSILATCNNSKQSGVSVSANSVRVAGLPNGTQILALNPPYIDLITATTDNVGCPPALSNSPLSTNSGQTFTPRQLIVSPDGSRAYITSDLGTLLTYNVSTRTFSTVTLVGGSTQTFNGGMTMDSKMLYIGAGGVNAVHRIDTSTNTDVQQIPLTFVPDLIAVRPK